MNSELQEISQTTQELKNCPVLIQEHDPLDPESVGYVLCNAFLQPMLTRTIIGDDYGEMPQYGVYFDCGHTFKEMEESLKWSEYV